MYIYIYIHIRICIHGVLIWQPVHTSKHTYYRHMYSDTQIHIFTHTYECVRLSANKNGCLVFALKLPYLYMLLHGNFGNINSRIFSHGIAGNITRLTSVQDLRDAFT